MRDPPASNPDSPRGRPPAWQRWTLAATLLFLAPACLLAIPLFTRRTPENAAMPTTTPPSPTASRSATSDSRESGATGKPATAPQEAGEAYEAPRRRMVDVHLGGRDITNQRVLDAMWRVPRHRFVPGHLEDVAYEDRPLPIGQGQTISQPYIVALMTQLARPRADSRALDVGTGSGYQAAVLAELCQRVYSIEIVEELAAQASRRLEQMGYTNVEVRAGDGYRGWPEHQPFDLIIVAAAPDHVPQPLVEQLAPGGRLVIPVGKFYQDLIVVEKQADGTTRQTNVIPVAFVPMTGEAQQR